MTTITASNLHHSRIAMLTPIALLIIYVYIGLLVAALAYYSIRMWLDLRDDREHKVRPRELLPTPVRPDPWLWVAGILATLGMFVLAYAFWWA